MGWIFRRLPDDEELSPSKPVRSSWKTLWHYRKEVFAVAAVAGFSYANYFLITNFMNGFLPLISSITKAEAMSLNTKLLVFDFFLLPVFGVLSLKIRKELLLKVALLGILTSVIPLFLFLHEATLFKAACVRLTLTFFGVCLAAPYHAWVYEITPPQHRYLIGAFGTALGGRLFGAPLPSLSLWLYGQTGLIISPAILLILVGIFPLITLLKQPSGVTDSGKLARRFSEGQ